MTAIPLEHHEVELARRSDLPDLVALISDAVPECHPQTVDELPIHWPTYRVVRDASGRAIAAGSLQPVDEERAEIRGLVVARSARGQGLAKLLVRELIDAAHACELEAVCVTRRPEFFEKFGFKATKDASWTLWLRPRRRLSLVRDSSRVAMRIPPELRR